MSDTVRVTTIDGVAVITLQQPPVNGLGGDVRTGLAERLEAVKQDDSISAIVITGAGRMFSGGADIREFEQPPPRDTPHLSTVVTAAENSSKPVIAAIHGVAAGGGLEVALGCHYRLAARDTRLGLPEVTLGLVPGAGGTPASPPADRCAGRAGLMSVEKAHALGLVDEIVEGALVEAAVGFARRVVDNGGPLRRTRELEDGLIDAKHNPGLFDAFRAQMPKRSRGFEAPYACVECIEAAATLPFNEGLAKEREVFQRLLASDQSRAQWHAFFAERETSKIPDVPKDTPTAPIRQAAVIGCGTMGGGIAMNFANADIPVTVVDVSQDALDRGLAVGQRNYAATVSKGRLSQATMDERMALISPTVSFDRVKHADVVIEAVIEQMDVKKDVFRTLDRVCKPDAILTTNTSTLDINEIAATTGRPDQVIGTHFFSPANVMRLMENVRGASSSTKTIATVMRLSKRLGKVGVLVGVCDGFVGNRMLGAYQRQADFLLEEGALPQQVDKAIYDFGMPMGPYQMADLAGLDVAWLIRQRQAGTRSQQLRYSFIADRICELGRFGQKTGTGWYRYEEGSRAPMPDPLIARLIEDVSAELGIKRRPVSNDEIVPRCLYPLVNEGAKILEEGLALRPSDIDIVWIYGYGFPRFRGGPMFWADLVGVKTIYDTLCELHAKHGAWLKPAPLLAQLAKDGRGFTDL